MKTKLSLRLILFASPLIILVLVSSVFTRSESNYMKSFENDDFSGTYQGTHYMYPEEGETSESPITITLTQNGNSIDAVYVQQWKTGDKEGETTWSCTGTIDSNGYFDLEGVIGTTANFYDDGRISDGEWNSNWIWESLSDGREVHGYIIATRLDEATTSSTTAAISSTTTTTTISTTTISCVPLWELVCGDKCCNNARMEKCCDNSYCCAGECCYGDCCKAGKICSSAMLGCVDEALACPLEFLYGEDSEEAEILRAFRDDVLSQTPVGQEIIELYYQWSPVIVKAMDGDEKFKEEVKGMIDGILPLIMGGIK